MNRWRTTIDGRALRTAIKERNISAIVSEVERMCQDITQMAVDEDVKEDFEYFLDEEVAFRDEDDDDDVIDLFLDEFYDLCDRHRIWVSIGLKTQAGMV